jgi:hypothetical protein
MWRASLCSAFTKLDAATLRTVLEQLVMPEVVGMFLDPLD